MRPTREQITGLLLAGGRATRMGGADKGLQTLHGEPLASHVLKRLAPQTGALLIIANRLHAPVSRVIIDDYSSHTYFARIILNVATGPVNLDCRPSDGVALAIRTQAPILASEAVMVACG